MTTNKLKRIPYGKADMNEIREGNFYYVDKTKYINNIEEKGDFLFLIRPRRFGKSLFLSMLEAYYDIAYKDRFDYFFKGTAIYEQPTEKRNSFLILKMNFSMVNADLSFLESAFLTYIKDTAIDFLTKYNDLLKINLDEAKTELKERNSASEVMVTLLRYCKRKKHKVYVIVDEYDNFANTILSESGEEEYIRITHSDGFLRSFFNVIKEGTTDTDSPISRLFMTGVSPITLDDVTSGFNIAGNISLDPDINEIMGFTREETTALLDYYRQTGKMKHSTEELMDIMSRWYNHYRFSPDADTEVFNTIQVLYFIQKYLVRGKIPRELIDRNVRIDYQKLKHLIIIDQKGTLQTNGNFSQFRGIIEKGQVITDLQTGFPIAQLVKPENFQSLLFYFGLLTITGETPLQQTILSIPNEFVKQLFYQFINETYEATDQFSINMSTYSALLSDFALSGKWEPLIQYIAGRMEASLGVRDLIDREKALQVFWNVYLGLNTYYLVYSEKELNQGYADLVMVPMPYQNAAIKYSCLIEFKYIKPSEYKDEIPQKILQQLQEEAEKQLNRYSTDEKFQKAIGSTILKKLVLIFCGHRLVFQRELSVGLIP